MSALQNISALDGRFANSIKDLSAWFAESAIMDDRLKVGIEYVIALGNEKTSDVLPAFSTEEQSRLRKVYQNFNAAGAEKINLGLTLVDRSGCNGCHVSANWRSAGKSVPDLRKLNEKSHPKWVSKWIKNPRSFRYNTRMPHIFEQANQEKPNVAKRNITEIASINHYPLENKE